MVITLIDAVKDRDVAWFDVSIVFLQASFPEDKFVIVKIKVKT